MDSVEVDEVGPEGGPGGCGLAELDGESLLVVLEAAASATWAQRRSPSASRASRAGAASTPSSAVSASRTWARS
jgi:hypothetical protein